MAETVPVVHFDTADYPSAEQFDAWRRAVVGFDITRTDAAETAPFPATIDAYAVGEMAVVAGRLGGGHRFVANQGADQPRNFSFSLYVDGRIGGDADGRVFLAGPGQVVATDWRRPVRADLSAGYSLTVVIPQAALEAELGAAPDLHGALIGGAAGRLLTEYLLSLLRELASVAPSETDTLMRATVRIIAACVAGLAAPATEDETALSRTVRRRVADHVETRLGSTEMTPAGITRDLGLSRSTLYRAFASAGGIAAYVQTRRLEAAHAALLDRDDPRSAKAIAFAHGFTNASHFTTAFRRRFGYPPGATRRGGGDISEVALDAKAPPEARLHALIANLSRRPL